MFARADRCRAAAADFTARRQRRSRGSGFDLLAATRAEPRAARETPPASGPTLCQRRAATRAKARLGVVLSRTMATVHRCLPLGMPHSALLKLVTRAKYNHPRVSRKRLFKATAWNFNLACCRSRC